MTTVQTLPQLPRRKKMTKPAKSAGLRLAAGTKELIELLEEHFPGYHPLKAMAEIAMSSHASPEIQAQMHKEICSYLYPKRKAMDIAIETKADIEFHMIVTPVVSK